MTDSESPDLPARFQQTIAECQQLYYSSGQLIVSEYPDLLPNTGEHFLRLMDDLHRALLVKVFITMCEADRRWTRPEKHLGELLLLHLWKHRLQGDQLKTALVQMSEKAVSLKWYSLVRPFDQIAPLRDRVGELETLVSRLANLIARADGPMTSGETASVKMIQDELHLHLRRIPIDSPDQHEQANEARVETIKKILHDAEKLPHQPTTATATQTRQSTSKVAVEQDVAEDEVESKTSPELLQEALASLDRLIGLSTIKHEVHTLTNFLKVQAARKKAGLPDTSLSLHMVFGGNPGTGKTTVARIVGRIFGAMGVLSKGHLVETDRSGLVAEYAGQTGPKTNKKIDEALDGVLFIDEAYSLISAEGEDHFGHEAVQTLLKRMEDDRNRLVVILAGYPDEIQSLLLANPGLSSRFSRHLDFADYTPLELSQIFGKMCDSNHYHIRRTARAKVLLGFQRLYELRDRHFGNGRTSRNLFEHAIRRMANRIAEIKDLSLEQLTTIEPEDIEFKTVPNDVLDLLTASESLRFHIVCPTCNHGSNAPKQFLGQRVRCPKCEHHFVAKWGEIIDKPTQTSAISSAEQALLKQRDRKQ
ncbi:MAG: AAA family ATPase [Planctomycetales bacterium]|nr:AAA family ATPase [Planctomycetales bacterium]